MGDLIVPFAYWNWTPANHKIAALAVSPDKNFLVTGATNGKLFMWNLRYSHKHNIDTGFDHKSSTTSFKDGKSRADLRKSTPDMKKSMSEFNSLNKSDSPVGKRTKIQKFEQTLDNFISSVIPHHKDKEFEKSEMRKSASSVRLNDLNNSLTQFHLQDPLKSSPNRHRRQISRDNIVVTNPMGNKEGEKGPKRPRISLRCILIGHTTAITALTSVIYNSIEAFVSVSTDGTVCIWSYYDGRCLASAENLLKCSPTTVILLPSGKHIACSGHHSDIEIVNLRQMKVSSVLSAHQNWVKAIYACEPKEHGASPLLISASSDVIQFWSLKKNEMDHPIQSLCLDVGDPIAIALAPNMKSLLIVTSQRWLLLTARDHNEVANVPCPDSEWVGGSFVSNRAVMIWSKEGNAYLYPIPRLEKAQPLSFSLMKDKGVAEEQVLAPAHENEDDEVVVESPKQQPANWRNRMLSKLNITDKSNTRVQPACIFCSTASDEEKEVAPTNCVMGIFGRVLVSGTPEGRVSIWIVPSRLEKIDNISRVLPWAASSPTDGWNETSAYQQQTTVTASLVIEEIPLLALGYNNGTISITSIPTTNGPPVFHNAHNGSVTCLLSIVDSRHTRLISGGVDFYVKVWNIKENNNLVPLWQFTNHTGPITRLIAPPVPDIPPKLVPLWKNSFFSISEDKTVGLFSLDGFSCKHIFGPHATFVSKVKWQVEQDYMLVECVDGSVSLWEMSSGTLDGVVTGEQATSVMEASDVLSPQYGDYSDALDKTWTTISVDIVGDSPIHLVMLNIKNLLKELNAKIKAEIGSGNPPNPSSPGKKEEKHDHPVDKSDDDEFSTKQAVTSSLAYKLFTYLLPWGIDPSIDSLCQNQLRLSPPNPEVTYAMTGYVGKITVLVPSVASHGAGRWQFSEFLSSLHSLSAVSFAKCLMSIPYLENSCSHLLSFYCSVLPEKLNYFIEPSLSFLALRWRDSTDDVMQAARVTLIATAGRIEIEGRRSFAQSIALQMRENPESKIQSVFTLAIFGSQWPDSLSNDLSQLVATELLRIIQDEHAESSHRILASELLGKGFSLWKQHIQDIEGLIQHLFVLSFDKDSSSPPLSQSNPSLNTNTVAGVAHHTLMLIGSAEPKQFVISLGKYIMSVQHPDGSQNKGVNMSPAAIYILSALIKQDPVALLPLLPRLVETVVKSLDPHLPALREACLGATTRVLHILVKQYPMVSFHQESQHLAVGTKEAMIVIYDLKTATRWHVLEGHTGPISAISFSTNGKMLSSYSIHDCEIRLWQTTSSLLGILGSNPHCIKTTKVPKVEKVLSQMNLLECVRLKWSGPATVTLMKDWEGSVTFKV